MNEPQREHDFLARIPSPSVRLWVGLCVILSIFIIFAIYSIHQIRWLEDFQINVVERNRKASIQLLRLQNDANLLGISLRDMTLKQAEFPIEDWQSEFSRLHFDMTNALALERQYSGPSAAGPTTEAFEDQIQGFWQTAQQVFDLAGKGEAGRARALIAAELEGKDSVIIATVASLLRSNDLAQIDAARRISSVYKNFKRDNLALLGLLLLLAIVTGLYTFQANRKTFERLGHLAQRLQSQSEQLRKLSWKLIDVQEETLRQVARDLHDEFGQILTAIGITLSRAGQKSDSPALTEDIQTVKGIVEETLRNIRDRSQMFRPAILDDFGLGKTLEWFASQFSRQAGVMVHLEGKEVVLPGDQAIHVYRIVQEALSNVARHSQAQEAWVSVEQNEKGLMVRIRDQGRGFLPEAAMNQTTGEGLGLMGMRERAQRLNGTLKVHSAPGKGTVVSVYIPAGERAGVAISSPTPPAASLLDREETKGQFAGRDTGATTR